MTRVPYDVSGEVLVSRLRKLGYEKDKQSGSHKTVTTTVNGEHHAYVPMDTPISPGTLRRILSDVAQHHGYTLEALIRFLKL